MSVAVVPRIANRHCDEIALIVKPSKENKTSSPIAIANIIGMSASGFAHILNTPNLVPSTGALSAAENASASTRRVSDGAMMPSSHSRAVA